MGEGDRLHDAKTQHFLGKFLPENKKFSPVASIGITGRALQFLW
jgi:hypothetical protein